MKKAEMREAILEAKFEKGLTWSEIGKAAGMSPEYVCSACLGMNHLDKKPADAVAKVLGLRKDVSAALQRFPDQDLDPDHPDRPADLPLV
jgi:cyanate lyase